MSNFSYSHSVLKRLLMQTHKNQGLFGKGLSLYVLFTNKVALAIFVDWDTMDLWNFNYLGFKYYAENVCWVLFTKRQIWDTSKLKEFADDSFNVDEYGRKSSRRLENTFWKGEIAYYKQFLIFSSTGCRPARLCHAPLSVVRPSVHASLHALTFYLNIFFSETTYWILMKFHRNVPAMVFFRISWKNLIPSKTLVAMATKHKKRKKNWNL